MAHASRVLPAPGRPIMKMIGPPGAGKTLLARAMPGILPRMIIDEALDVIHDYYRQPSNPASGYG